MVSVVVVGWYQFWWLDGTSCGSGRMVSAVVVGCGGRMVVWSVGVVWWWKDGISCGGRMVSVLVVGWYQLWW